MTDKQEQLEDLYIEMHRLEDRIQDIKGMILDLESENRASFSNLQNDTFI